MCVFIYILTWCINVYSTLVCVCVCVSHPAPTAIYSLWDLVYFALSKCQHCQSGPPISPGPCCWALPVFISADRWTLRGIPPPATHIHTHTHAHTLTHKGFGQSVVNGLTPQTLALQTHPLPVLVRKNWEQQWRGRDERHSRVKQRHRYRYSTAWTQTCGHYICLTPADTIIKSQKNNILKRNLSSNKHGKGITSIECVLYLVLGLCVFSVFWAVRIEWPLL